jgi:hypothetical protein
MVEPRSWRGVLDTTLYFMWKFCQWLATGRWFSSGIPVSTTNKTDRHDITEILLKVALNTINPFKMNYLNFIYKLSKIIKYQMQVLSVIFFMVFNAEYKTVWETIFFKNSPKWRVDWNKYSPKWNRARHVWRVTFFLNLPRNTKYRILRTIGRYFFPLNTLASTYRPHRPMQGWS